MKLSIIIPVYNEEATVSAIIAKVKSVKLPGGLEREIVVVDDGSSDQSAKLLEKTSGIKFLRHSKNKGKGAAIRTGLEKSTGEVVLIQDADLEYDPNDYFRLISPILEGRAKVVYGTRLKTLPLIFFGKAKTPFAAHYLGNTFLSFVTNLLYGGSLSDMETCYKVFKREVVAKMRLNSDRFEIEPEITAKILRAGHKILEVPIKTKPRGYDEGKKITWIDGFGAIWTLLKYKFVK